MIPVDKSPDSDEPKTIFEFERRRRSLEPGEEISGTIPRPPSSSPWSSGIDQLTGAEPTIDRSEDASFVSVGPVCQAGERSSSRMATKFILVASPLPRLHMQPTWPPPESAGESSHGAIRNNGSVNDVENS
jgi:hypothetical protein